MILDIIYYLDNILSGPQPWWGSFISTQVHSRNMCWHALPKKNLWVRHCYQHSNANRLNFVVANAIINSHIKNFSDLQISTKVYISKRKATCVLVELLHQTYKPKMFYKKKACISNGLNRKNRSVAIAAWYGFLINISNLWIQVSYKVERWPLKIVPFSRYIYK